jgi:PPP family 3-phenylpropionic acid transporter
MALRAIKFHYVLVYAVLGALMPYLSVYAEQRGLSDAEIGWVIGAWGVAVLVAPPLHTLLADRWLANRTVIGLCFAVAAAALVALTQLTSFAGLFIAHLLFSLGYTSLIPLLDGLTFGITQPADEAEPAGAGGAGAAAVPFRHVRIWGSIGFMLPGAIVAGLWLTDLDEPTIVRWAIWLAMATCIAGAVAALRLPANRLGGDDARGSGLPTMAALRAVRGPVAIFVLCMMLVFASASIMYAFYPLYLTKLDVPAAFVGLITNLGVIVEIAFILCAGWIMRHIGLRGVLIIGILSQVARMVLLALWPGVAMAVASQVFHGPMVLALYVLAPMYLDHRAAPGYRNSMQGLYALAVFGIARMVGTAGGGHVSDHFGKDTLAGLQAAFWLSAALGGAAVILAITFRDRAACRALQEEAAG